MNHWQMIVFAYGLTFVALALEVAFLFRRRRSALRPAAAWLPSDPASPAAHDVEGAGGAGVAETRPESRAAAGDGRAGAGAGAGAGATS